MADNKGHRLISAGNRKPRPTNSKYVIHVKNYGDNSRVQYELYLMLLQMLRASFQFLIRWGFPPVGAQQCEASDLPLPDVRV